MTELTQGSLEALLLKMRDLETISLRPSHIVVPLRNYMRFLRVTTPKRRFRRIRGKIRAQRRAARQHP